MFKKLLALGDRYAKQSTWKDFAMVKMCLCSLGIIIGTLVPKEQKKKVACVSAGVYALTYVPLMAKLLVVAMKKDE